AGGLVLVVAFHREVAGRAADDAGARVRAVAPVDERVEAVLRVLKVGRGEGRDGTEITHPLGRYIAHAAGRQHVDVPDRDRYGGRREVVAIVHHGDVDRTAFVDKGVRRLEGVLALREFHELLVGAVVPVDDDGLAVKRAGVRDST